jgi:DNA-binding transcriptional MerR regulator
MAKQEPPYTIGRLGELCGLSRSTLIYYDSIGLLEPSGRSISGYRLYSKEDRSRLERIVAFRALGLELERIGELLDLPEDGPAGSLLGRVFEINGRIAELRAQQRGILDLLEARGGLGVGPSSIRALGKIAREAGITESNYRGLHEAFESVLPAEHRRLLGLLGFGEAEIEEFLAKLKKGL